MRSALCVLLCGAPLYGAGTAVAAQQRDVTFEEPQPVTVTGFAVGRASYDRALGTNGFSAGKIAVSLFKPAGDFYLFGQLTTARQGGATTTELDNLIVSWTPHAATRWTLAFGRFDAPVGVERDDEPLNLVPGNSFTFELARPSKLTGVIARLTASPRLELAAAVTNGWNVEEDNNRGKTALARVQWLPVQAVAVGVSGLYGPERSGSDGHQRSLLVPDVTLDLGRCIVGAELNVGREVAAGGDLTWGGGAATVFLRLGRSFGISARYDHLSDAEGVVSGTSQVLRSVTVGPMWFYSRAQEGIFSNVEHTRFHLPQIVLRAALRADYSTRAFFQDQDGGLVRNDTRGVLELVYIF
jgi:putative OmpL-like beta-barrel porin-2